ncbi:ATP-binding protein [Sulfidibacter corallicola]|uniref:ATP-binding protein n=1 Tax=Sulfidibacter corallicola TaxID=2818388 RepID=UPI001F3CB334|nr:ATP-binding protein [Sulfidibacter corallicola]
MILPKSKTPAKTDLSSFSVMLYGGAKIGKSEFCSQAPSALFLATEPGLNALETFQVPIHKWEDLLEACAELAKGEHTFQTIIVDTIDLAYRHCLEYVCAKHKMEHPADLGYGKGYALVDNEFTRVMTKMAGMPYGLILVSHSKTIDIETRTGKVQKVVPTLPDKARKFVLGLVDLILFCDLKTQVVDGKPVQKRVIHTKPSAHFEAGDRTKRLPAVLPLNFPAFQAAFEHAQQEAKTEKHSQDAVTAKP